METFPTKKGKPRRGATPCRWLDADSSKPCSGKYHGGGGNCDTCGRKNPKAPNERQLLTSWVSDGDGEVLRRNLVEVRTYADFDLAQLCPGRLEVSTFPNLSACLFGEGWPPAQAALYCALHRVNLALLIEVE